MACTDQDQQPTPFKHYCRICKKGFMCGRALGGHMRAHGIGDEIGNLDDDDTENDWEEKLGGNDTTNNRRMYQLRTNPNRLKSCRVCENCGKEFLSWKSFLEHGKCGSDDAESLVSSPESEWEEDMAGRRRCGWSKRKRSLRAKVDEFSTSTDQSTEEEDLLLARCLVDLANARVDTSVAAEQESSCASASKEEERRHQLMAFLSPLAGQVHPEKAKGISKGLFECKACKKVFNSHQALGGHRASHKKVKGCYAAKQDQLDNDIVADVIMHDDFFATKSTSSFQFEHTIPLVGAAKKKSKVHECSICHRVFSTGQALGGHKRCHWITSNTPDANSLTKFHFHDHMDQQIQQRSQYNKSEALDLNLPAEVGDLSRIKRDPRDPLSFQVSTEIHLHPWIDVDAKAKDDSNLCLDNRQHDHQNDEADGQENKNNFNPIITTRTTNNVDDDEVDSKVKLTKLSDLKDMNINGTSTQWLQVGIASTTEAATNT